MRQRGIAQRGPVGILVEACPGAPAGTPLIAFVLEPRISGDDAGRLGGLSVHAYFVPATPTPVAEVAAGTAAGLQSLLGLKERTLASPLLPRVHK